MTRSLRPLITLRSLVLTISACALAVINAGAQPVSPADVAKVEHPFILWNADDIDRLRKMIGQEPWARERWAALQEETRREERALVDLLRFAAFDDQQAGERQKNALFDTIGSQELLGAAQWVNVVRYDTLYPTLTEEERAEVETVFRGYIETAVFYNAIYDPDIFNDEKDYSRYDALYYKRTGWLPNIIWPRKASANLMAAVLRDEDLIRQVWAQHGSWQWLFDEYLADSGFYGEEFSKMHALVGEMLLYAQAVERLGLDELGFGYTGRHGATLRGHVESVLRLGYPRVELHSGLPHYPRLTAGDIREGHRQGPPTWAFQHAIVNGFTPGGQHGLVHWWSRHGAWGGEVRGKHPQWDGYGNFTPKMQIPFWFEVAHRKWPEAGFDYFLAQMREPGQQQYLPSLYFGLDPIDPATVTAPAALSFVAPERGLAMLRADESPAYWESPAPAVGLRLAAPYAHKVSDSFALAGYYAFNRPIYLNRHATRGYASGWSRSILSHCGVMIDGQEPAFAEDVIVRRDFFPDLKYVSARSRDVFPGSDLARTLMLTREYLVDVVHVENGGSAKELVWLVHTLGLPQGIENLASWEDLDLPAKPKGEWMKAFAQGTLLHDSTSDAWEAVMEQRLAIDDASQAQLPAEWYDRGIGVKVRMLGAPGTLVALARTPVRDSPDEEPAIEEEPQAYETGGVSVIAIREADRTAFVALHEPFEDNKGRVRPLREIAQSDDHVAFAVAGEGINDIVLVRHPPATDDPMTVRHDNHGEITFARYALLRIGKERVQVFGDVRSLRLQVKGEPQLFLNDRRHPARYRDGCLILSGKN